MASESGFKLHIGNLDPNVHKSELEEAFSKYGKLVTAWVARSPPGFGFVTFEVEEEGRKAIEELDGTMFAGKPIKIEPARSTAERRPGDRRHNRRGGDYRYNGRSDDYPNRYNTFRTDRQDFRSPPSRYGGDSRSPDRDQRDYRDQGEYREVQDYREQRDNYREPRMPYREQYREQRGYRDNRERDVAQRDRSRSFDRNQNFDRHQNDHQSNRYNRYDDGGRFYNGGREDGPNGYNGGYDRRRDRSRSRENYPPYEREGRERGERGDERRERGEERRERDDRRERGEDRRREVNEDRREDRLDERRGDDRRGDERRGEDRRGDERRGERREERDDQSTDIRYGNRFQLVQ